MNLIIITTSENGIKTTIVKYTFGTSEGSINPLHYADQDTDK